MLIEVGWKKESRSLSSSRASPQLSSLARELTRTPLTKMKDSITDDD